VDFYVPNNFEKKVLYKGDSVFIPSGVRVQVPDGYAFIAHNKSGIATKFGLVVGACVVDEDYEGEIHLHVIKATNIPDYVMIEPGMKIIQLLLLPVYYAPIEIVNELPERNTERGTGGFGSTGIY
jgi:dUTP pyrophosphatase